MFSFLHQRMEGQIIIDTTSSLESLVQNALAASSVSISNITFRGFKNRQLASFTNYNPLIPIDRGLYLTSGDVFEINNLNSLETGAINDTITDQDLADIINAQLYDLYDGAILEFDFVPNGDNVSFRYIFFSDEYPEYVCSEYNDVFGFFMSGANINGPFQNNAENIAILPNSDIEVTINTVNGGESGEFGSPSLIECDLDNSSYYVDNFLISNNIVYDGFTVVLEAESEVICGETYHIKLAIADIFDPFLDSGVFLEGSSFTSSGLNMYLEGLGYDPVTGKTVEGCPVDLVITKPTSLAGSPYTVNLDWQGVTTPNLDFSGHPTSVQFSAGQDILRFPLDIILDNMTEPDELITIVSDDCAASGFSFYIVDPTAINLNLPDTIYLGCIDSTQIYADVEGNIEQFDITWTDDNNTVISNTPITGWLSNSDTGIYHIHIIDLCNNNQINEQVVLTALSFDVFETIYDTTCNIIFADTSFDFFTNAQGCDSAIQYISIYEPNSITDVTETSCNISVNDTALLYLLDQFGCDSIINRITIAIGSVEEVNLNSTCNPNLVDTATFILTNVNGCDSIITQITILSAINIDSIIVDEDCELLTADIELIVSSSAVPPLQYTLSSNGNDNTVTNPIEQLANGTYSITVTDSIGCSASEMITIDVDSITPFTAYPDEVTIFNGESVTIELIPPLDNIFWSPDEFLSCDTCTTVTVSPSNDIQYIISHSQNGCVVFDTVTIKVENTVLAAPTAFTPNDDGINDFFHVIDNDIALFHFMKIYNRWGELVFETDDQYNGWNGTYNNEVQEMDVYVYIIQAELVSGKTEEIEGAFILIR